MKSNKTGITGGAVTAELTRALEFTPIFFIYVVSIARSSVFSVVFCRSLFVLVAFFFEY